MSLINVIGFVAAICTSISFLPQAIKVIKTKHAKDLSLGMYIIFNFGIFLWFVYGIFTKNLPIIFANALTLIFGITILILKIKYK